MNGLRNEGRQAPPLGVYGLSFGFAGATDLALDEIAFELERGAITALIGPNGSGKSTLMKLVSGVLGSRAFTGQIRYHGQDSQKLTQAERSQRVAYVGSDLSAEFPLTAHEAVMLGRSCLRGFQGSSLLSELAPGDSEKIREAMELCRCWDLRSRMLHSLSGGERQLVSIARAFVQGSGILFLDESLSRMDLHHQEAMGKVLRERVTLGLTVLLVSHDLNLATEWADSVILLKQGRKIAEGSVGQTLSGANLKKLYPGVELVIAPSPASGAPKVFFSRGPGKLAQ